jgi:hypothetical protein
MQEIDRRSRGTRNEEGGKSESRTRRHRSVLPHSSFLFPPSATMRSSLPGRESTLSREERGKSESRTRRHRSVLPPSSFLFPPSATTRSSLPGRKSTFSREERGKRKVRIENAAAAAPSFLLHLSSFLRAREGALVSVLYAASDRLGTTSFAIRFAFVRNSRDVGPRFHVMSVQDFTPCRPGISRHVGPPFHVMSVQLVR